MGVSNNTTLICLVIIVIKNIFEDSSCRFNYDTLIFKFKGFCNLSKASIPLCPKLMHLLPLAPRRMRQNYLGVSSLRNLLQPIDGEHYNNIPNFT